jgi:hypothetical protein
MRAALLMLALFLGACAPRLQPPGPGPAEPEIAGNHLVMEDGALLPLRVWKPVEAPTAVILALHGFNDYSKAFEDPAKAWVARGTMISAASARRPIAAYGPARRG